MQKIVKILFSLSVIIVFFCVSSAILRGKSVEGIFDYTRKIDEFYAEPLDALDVIVIGSSNAFCNVGAMELWENYGIPTYLFANGNQTPEESLFYLQEVYKTQKPKVIMLEMHMFTSAATSEFINPYFEWNMNGIPWSLEKANFMKKLPDLSCAKENGSDVVLFYAPLLGNHSLDLEDDVRSIAQNYNIELWAYRDPADYELDYFYDYMDSGHMNLTGQEKFTQIIGKRLVETFGLPDRRTDPNWKYYAEDYQTYLAQIQSNQ